MGLLSAWRTKEPTMGEVVPFKREQHDAHVWIWRAMSIANVQRPPLVRDKAYDDAPIIVGVEIEPRRRTRR